MIETFKDLISKKDNEAIALKDYKTEVTYGQLRKKVSDLSYLLQAKSGAKKYRLLFAEPPSILLSIAYLGVVCSGGLAFFINPEEKNIADWVDKYEIDIVVAESSECSIHSVSISDFFCMNFELPYSEKKIDVYSACTAFFTSGTSGESKCVLLSEKNLCRNVVAGCSVLEYRVDDIHLNTLPFYHAYGITCSLLATIYSGGRLCFGESVATFFKDLQFFSPTFIQTVPMVLRTLLVYVQNHRVALTKILSGGAYTSADLINRFRKVGIQVYSCYGMTECSPCISCNDGKIEKDSSVGKLLPCNKIKFVDEEIFLSGSNIMLGYFGDKRQVGWFQTGDCGYMDKDGYLYLTGRKKGSVKMSNGEKVFPEQIENLVNSFWGVIESRATLSGGGFILEVFIGDNFVDLNSLEKYLTDKLSMAIKINKIVIARQAFPKTSTMKIRRK